MSEGSAPQAAPGRRPPPGRGKCDAFHEPTLNPDLDLADPIPHLQALDPANLQDVNQEIFRTLGKQTFKLLTDLAGGLLIRQTVERLTD